MCLQALKTWKELNHLVCTRIDMGLVSITVKTKSIFELKALNFNEGMIYTTVLSISCFGDYVLIEI